MALDSVFEFRMPRLSSAASAGESLVNSTNNCEAVVDPSILPTQNGYIRVLGAYVCTGSYVVRLRMDRTVGTTNGAVLGSASLAATGSVTAFSFSASLPNESTPYVLKLTHQGSGGVTYFPSITIGTTGSNF